MMTTPVTKPWQLSTAVYQYGGEMAGGVAYGSMVAGGALYPWHQSAAASTWQQQRSAAKAK